MTKDIDWSSLGFSYMKTDYRYVSRYKDGKWDAGALTEDDTVVLSESACVLQYSQNVFEGMKAYRTEDGHIVIFRPDLNADRMVSSCKRMCMPVFPKERFIDAVREVVLANKEYVPPYGTGASMYLRPFMFGSNPTLGVKPANEFEFRIFASPVGPYFKGKARPLNLRICDMDRAAPKGTGGVKAGLNYAMSLYAIDEAHRLGFDENLYLDSASRNFIEETGGANIFFVTKDKRVITPKSDSILPSITRRSMLIVARDILGIPVEERRIAVDELVDFDEAGLCGTAAVISPVGSITYGEQIIEFPSGLKQAGEITQRIYDALTGIQMGRIKGPEGWLYTIE
jgi:branched-chain amino acid aminotransferase